jgi:hypothetical protein
VAYFHGRATPDQYRAVEDYIWSRVSEMSDATVEEFLTDLMMPDPPGRPAQTPTEPRDPFRDVR